MNNLGCTNWQWKARQQALFSLARQLLIAIAWLLLPILLVGLELRGKY